MQVLVTGNAGFVGFNTAKRLLERGVSSESISSTITKTPP
jgi:nucleoside-diphosphate-sugar epimerase